MQFRDGASVATGGPEGSRFLPAIAVAIAREGRRSGRSSGRGLFPRVTEALQTIRQRHDPQGVFYGHIGQA